MAVRTADYHLATADYYLATAEPQLSEWLGTRSDRRGLNAYIVRAEDRPDVDAHANSPTVRRLMGAFTTRDGSWDPVAGLPFSIPAWARDRWLRSPTDRWYIRDGGGATHLFGCLTDGSGTPQAGAGFVFFTSTLQNHGLEVSDNARDYGWANTYMASSSGFDAPGGAHGPWFMSPFGFADVLCGLGLPYPAAGGSADGDVAVPDGGLHVSTFAWWQEVQREGGGGGGGNGGGTVDLSTVERRLAQIAGDIAAMRQHLGA